MSSSDNDIVGVCPAVGWWAIYGQTEPIVGPVACWAVRRDGTVVGMDAEGVGRSLEECGDAHSFTDYVYAPDFDAEEVRRRATARAEERARYAEDLAGALNVCSDSLEALAEREQSE